MYRFNSLFFVVIAMVTCGAIAAPNSINYQGKIDVNGEPFTGTGEFRFAIVTGSGGYFWTNDGTVPPMDFHSATVTEGLFSIVIGDDGGMLPLPETLFEENDRYLRVWFNDQTTGWQLLSPDQFLSSVPYSLQTIRAEYSETANHAMTADNATTADFADNASHASTAMSADFAGVAAIANYAENADTVDFRDASDLTRARGSLGLRFCIALVGIYPSQSFEQSAVELRSLEPYIGEIMLFAGNFPPQGWAFCEGQLLSIVQNTALFSLVGTTYGGDGETTFGLPDLRGRVPIGVGIGLGGTPVSWGEKCGVPGCAESQ